MGTLRTPRTVGVLEEARRGERTRTVTPTRQSQPKRKTRWTSTNHPRLISSRRLLPKMGTQQQRWPTAQKTVIADPITLVPLLVVVGEGVTTLWSTTRSGS